MYIGIHIVAVVLVAVLAATHSVAATVAALYGAALGAWLTWATRRNTDHALAVAMQRSRRGVMVVVVGFFLRLAVAILGLGAGYMALELQALPMLGGFVLMMMVRVLAMLALDTRYP